jgi:glycosyltransferase involved in cell wall biosynthesis
MGPLMSAFFRPCNSSGTKPTRICFITGFPPSSVRLSEYGYHLAQALHEHPEVELIVLADRNGSSHKEPTGITVDRCWRMNSMWLPLVLALRVSRYRPDVVWFNLGFSSLADRPIPAFLALLAPSMLKLLGFHVQVTLHTFTENVDLADAGVKHQWLYRLFGAIATRFLLCAHDVAVLLPSYRDLLIRKYGAEPDRIRCHPHGVFAVRRSSADQNARRHVLALGSWGTYKRLELLLGAFEQIAQDTPGCKLIVAGRSHPKTPGYLERLMKQNRHVPWLEFRGYIPEEDLETLFATAAVVVLPYASSAGSSGVAHQACEFGVPIVATETPDFREMAREENLQIEFVPQNDAGTLAATIAGLLRDDERREQITMHNRAVARQFSIESIADDYLKRFQRKLASPTLASVPPMEARS